jgi:hypothetical protein
MKRRKVLKSLRMIRWLKSQRQPLLHNKREMLINIISKEVVEVIGEANKEVAE